MNTLNLAQLISNSVEVPAFRHTCHKQSRFFPAYSIGESRLDEQTKYFVPHNVTYLFIITHLFIITREKKKRQLVKSCNTSCNGPYPKQNTNTSIEELNTYFRVRWQNRNTTNRLSNSFLVKKTPVDVIVTESG